jgi:signal transduction histidine kinase
MTPGLDQPKIPPFAAWFLAWIALVLCIALDVYGLRTLANSPHIGANFHVVENSVLISDLQSSSALHHAGVRAGDTLLAINGHPVDPAAFAVEPEEYTSWRNRDVFWSWQSYLDQATSLGALQMELRHGAQTISIEAPVTPLGWSLALRRTAALRLVGWAFMLCFFLIWIKRQNECSALFLFCGVCVFASLQTEAIYIARDLCLAPAAFHLLGVINYATSLSSVIVLHFSWVFPSPIVWLRRHPWLRLIPWVVCAILLTLHFGKTVFVPPTVFFLLIAISLVGFMTIMVLRMKRSDDPILRPQLKWMALAAIGGFLPYVLLSAVPALMALPRVPPSLSLLFAVATPFCITFAVFRYRLLDVDRIFDWVLVHAIVLVALTCFEITFWSWIGRHYASDTASIPLLIAFSMFIVVTVYAPLRIWLFRLLTRISGRARPSMIDSIRHLLERISVDADPQSALEETLQWTLRPSRIFWLAPAQLQDALLERMETVRDGLLGFELGDVCPQQMLSTAWVPIHTGEGLAVVVLWPQGGRGWNRHDLRIARTLGHFGEPLLKIQNLQHEHSKTTNAMRQQRDEMLREMHDGLGGQIFGASLLTQPPDDASPDEMRRRLSEANLALVEALDSLRTGLTILSSPPGAFGPALIALLLRAERVLNAAGVRMETDVSDEVVSLQLESQTLFALLRATQEGITNIARHARAKNASVRITIQDSALLVRIKDDGVGFNIKDINIRSGLENIKMRMKMVDGVAVINSAPQQGCTLLLELKLKNGIDETENAECFAD